MSTDPVGLVIHDLKNELGALEAALERCATRLDDPELHANHRQCMALRQRMVQFLTLYGRDQALNAQAVDESPSAVLAAAAHHAQALHPRLRVRLDAEDEAPPFWYFDARLVRMALDAALHNAARFAKSEIRLQALTLDRFLVLRVDDDGPGPDASAPDPDAQGATGLGTALCQAVAAAHRSGGRQGRVLLSQRPGGGARFELWLA